MAPPLRLPQSPPPPLPILSYSSVLIDRPTHIPNALSPNFLSQVHSKSDGDIQTTPKSFTNSLTNVSATCYQSLNALGDEFCDN
jgi:hypothetical protein